MIDLWIDHETKLVERMEMRWPSRPGPIGPGGPGMRYRPLPPRPPPGEGFPFGPPPDMGPRPMPPILVVIDRVEPPDLSSDWFSPEAHRPQ